MKRFGKIMLAVMVILALACTSASAANYTPGTYTGSAQGNNGPVTVEVIVTESEIQSIAIKEHTETTTISEIPFEQIPKDIIAYQSLAVDTVAGATNSSKAVIAAVEAALIQAGASADALYAEIEKEAAPVVDIEASADVIIVGAGGAGMSAAIAATDEGASVIVVEKTAMAGGNSLVSGGIYNAVDPERQKVLPATSIDSCYALTEVEPRSEKHAALMATLKAELDAYVASGSDSLFDSIALHILQTYDGGDYIGDLDLIENMCVNSLPSLEWLQGMGLEINPVVKQGTGSLWQRTHYTYGSCATAYFEVFDKVLNERADQCSFLFNTTATSLITDENGAVVGVEAVGKDGGKVTLKANKGVILATGGFAGNVEMRVQYCQGEKWPNLGDTLPTSNVAGVTGDGIRMADAIGAQLIDMDQIQLLQSCDPETGYASNASHNGAASYVFINAEGKRFTNEGGRRDVVSADILAQTDGVVWMLQSADSIKDPATQLTADGRPVADLLATGETGWCTAPTLEAMAEVMGVPYDALKESIDEFNTHVASQLPDEFGRTLFNYEYVTGPWYAFKRAPAAHHTMGGIKIDTECHVYNTAGEIIPGLYAAGEVTGGVHGGNRLGGNAIVDFIVHGRIAGTQAAQDE